MVSFLKYRVVFITLLFSLFGGALSLLLKIDEMQTYYPALAALIALSVSLLVSLLTKGKWTTSFRKKIKVAATVLFLLFLATIAFHTYYFINNTFKFVNFGGKVAYHVKGSTYTDAALRCRADHPSEITSDAKMLELCFEGLPGKTDAWPEDSIKQNVFKLIASYSVVILFFVATISLLTEVLASKYTRHKQRTKQDGPKHHLNRK